MTDSSALSDLIDIGANLGHDSFDNDLVDVIQSARDIGVSRFVLTGATVPGSVKAAAIAADYPGIAYSTAGVHPHHASELDAPGLAQLRELAGQPCVVSLGECGLDYFRNFSTPADQEAAFHQQLELAVEFNMPVFLHQRDAIEPFIAIVREYRDRLPRAVAHCFTGSGDDLGQCLDLDLHIGITGWICDERRGAHLKDLVGRIPADRLMVETDAPYLLPRDLKPKPKSRRNEPRYLPHVLRAVAAAAGRPAEQVARETSATARRFFAID
ncbi:MAG: TatD family hydrolase, partial [Pseudomonadota bacterium]